MLTALLPDKSQQMAYLLEPGAGPFECPACKSNVILKKGSIRTHHFSHRPGSDCPYGTGESEIHRLAKLEIYEALKKETSVIRCAVEFPLNGCRPDVIFKTTKVTVAIEVQVSHLTPEDLRRRTENYHRLGIHVLWLIPEFPPINNEEYSPSVLEKYLHTMYFGKVHYWVRGLGVMPVHFRPKWLYHEAKYYIDWKEYEDRTYSHDKPEDFEEFSPAYWYAAKRYSIPYWENGARENILNMLPKVTGPFISRDYVIGNSRLWTSRRKFHPLLDVSPDKIDSALAKAGITI